MAAATTTAAFHSSTPTMMGPGGVPVLYAAHEVARAAGLHTWYMPLARRVPGDGSGFVLAARLHRHSRFTYRLEVLRDQYDLLQDAGGLGGVVGSIAANSGDPSFPGSVRAGQRGPACKGARRRGGRVPPRAARRARKARDGPDNARPHAALVGAQDARQGGRGVTMGMGAEGGRRGEEAAGRPAGARARGPGACYIRRRY